MERNRLKREERVAGLLHRFNLFLKALGESQRTELIRGTNVHGTFYRGRLVENTPYVAGVALVTSAVYLVADINVVVATGVREAGQIAYCHVVVACTVTECIQTDSHVLIAERFSDSSALQPAHEQPMVSQNCLECAFRRRGRNRPRWRAVLPLVRATAGIGFYRSLS
jgi:hypothetical protein